MLFPSKKKETKRIEKIIFRDKNVNCSKVLFEVVKELWTCC
jgi:hypothetical protein